jgi:hypothetical protein
MFVFLSNELDISLVLRLLVSCHLSPVPWRLSLVALLSSDTGFQFLLLALVANSLELAASSSLHPRLTLLNPEFKQPCEARGH